MYKRFQSNDLFYNRIKAHPTCNFLLYRGIAYYNDKPAITGLFTSSIYPSVGRVNLYEMNVDRGAAALIYPFITKEGSLTAFRTISTTDFNNDFSYGDTVTGSYPLQATLQTAYYSSGQARLQINALENTLDHYRPLSQHYQYNGTHGNKGTQELSHIDIPSIFYGSSIKKGSISLKYYDEADLVGELRDVNRNGELIEIGPAGSNGTGSVAGVVLYNEGAIILTGSWLHPSTFRWRELANTTDVSSSFTLDFEGTNYVSTVTMLCHAKEGECNHSNNPTFVKFDQRQKLIQPHTNSVSYREQDEIEIKNIVNHPYSDPTASFDKQTYISRVGIYDENRNLIGVAKLANPIRKREEDSFTFKLKLDI